MGFVRKDYSSWVLMGEGGEAKVFRARQQPIGRLVAIRQVKPEAAERAAREAEIHANLRHQGLAVLIDFGYDRGRFHLVQDYIQGVSPQEYGALPPLAAVRCARALVKTLAFLHSKEIVHGDLNPGNLLLTSAEECVLVDFGMVRRAGAASASAMGAPRYFAPEHFRGEPFTPATDIFSFGSLFFALLTGRDLFGEDRYEDLANAILGIEQASRRAELTVRWSEWAPELKGILEGCLQYEPEDRFEDMDELDEHLEIAELALRRQPEALVALLETGTAITKASSKRELAALDSAYHRLIQIRDYANASLILDDMLVQAPGDTSIHDRMRWISKKRRQRKLGFRLVSLSALLLFIALLLFALHGPGVSESSLDHLGQEFLTDARKQTGETAAPILVPASATRLRMVRVPDAASYTQVWVDSVPQVLEEGMLRLMPGIHKFRGLQQGNSNAKQATIIVPDTGASQWK